MATSLTLNDMSVNVNWTFTNQASHGNVSDNTGFKFQKKLTDGTGDGNANRLYVSKTTLAGGQTLNLDLAGTLTDVFGNTITFAKIKALYVELLADTTASAVTVGGHATAAFVNWVADATDKVRVKNPGCLFLGTSGAAGYAVTATSADMLSIVNEDGVNTATLKIVLVGTSA